MIVRESHGFDPPRPLSLLHYTSSVTRNTLWESLYLIIVLSSLADNELLSGIKCKLVVPSNMAWFSSGCGWL